MLETYTNLHFFATNAKDSTAGKDLNIYFEHFFTYANPKDDLVLIPLGLVRHGGTAMLDQKTIVYSSEELHQEVSDRSEHNVVSWKQFEIRSLRYPVEDLQLLQISSMHWLGLTNIENNHLGKREVNTAFRYGTDFPTRP